MQKLLLLLLLAFLSSVPALTQQHNIRLNLAPGATVPFKKQSTVDIKAKIPFFGTGYYKRTDITEFSFTVLEKRGENYILECVVASEKVKQTARVEKNKKKKNPKDIAQEKELNEQLEKALKDDDMRALKIGQKVRVEVTPLFKQKGETVRLDTAALSQEEANRIAKLLDVFVEVFPEKPVLLGEKWTIKEEDGITVTSILSAVTDESYIITNNADMKMNMGIAKASGRGTVKNEIDPHTGLLKRNETRFPFKGTVWALLLRIKVEGTVTSICEIVQ